MKTPMPTVRDVAHVAGVSVATVSRVINNDPKVKSVTRDKVRKVMQEVGYKINEHARSLTTRKSNTVGVVIPDITKPFFSLLANGVDQVAKQLGKQMLLSIGGYSAESEKQALELLLDRQCQSIVFHSKFMIDLDLDLITYAKKVPGLIFIGREIPSLPERCIWLDNYLGGAIAANHLLSLSHHDYAMVNSVLEIEDPTLRLSGFQSELDKHGVVIEQSNIAYDEPSYTGGEQATRKLLATGAKFTALFAYNDAMAIGAMSALNDAGLKVPQDVSIVGFDNVILSRYSSPKLTTLHYPIEEMARTAAQIALNNDVSNETTTVDYKPELVIRKSTCKAKIIN